MTRLSTVKDQVAQADGLPAVLDTEQAWCLTLVTNAVVAWTTDYYGPAVDAMRKAGRPAGARRRAGPHLPGPQRQRQLLRRAITVDIDHELAQLDRAGYWPLRGFRKS